MTETDWREAEERLMEEVVSRGNMMKAVNRAISNKCAAGVDGMTTGRLKEYLLREWPRIKEELLTGRYQPKPVENRAGGEDPWDTYTPRPA